MPVDRNANYKSAERQHAPNSHDSFLLLVCFSADKHRRQRRPACLYKSFPERNSSVRRKVLSMVTTLEQFRPKCLALSVGLSHSPADSTALLASSLRVSSQLIHRLEWIARFQYPGTVMWAKPDARIIFLCIRCRE